MSITNRTWNNGMMTSLRQDWATPRKLFEMLDKEFQFTLDVCATSKTAKCTAYLSERALERLWIPPTPGAIWCNPPYGRKLGEWAEKAYKETCHGRRDVTIVMLLPARTDTQWFHDYILPHAEIRFLRGRLYFDDGGGRAPFPSMIVIFRQKKQRTKKQLTLLGWQDEIKESVLGGEP